MTRVLLVDDDDALRQVLAEHLRMHGAFVTVEAATGAEAIARAGADQFDLCLLDLGLADLDGREVCRRLRRAGLKAPVIMLTAADSEADIVAGLDAGADDYVTKPFRLSVLLARIRAQLRRHLHSDDAVFSLGPYRFRPSDKMLLDSRRNRRIVLTERETALLKFLLRAGGAPVRRDVLLGEVWGYHPDVETHTVETHVYRLRRKIEDDPNDAKILIKERGGYRLAT